VAYRMPDWVFRDTLTVLASHNKQDRSGGESTRFSPVGVDIKANVAKPQVVEIVVGGRVRNILRATFTTPVNPTLTDPSPSGKLRPIGKGDGLVWSGDGQQWESAGPLTPRGDDKGNPVHYWGTMERVT
jgi:hypothetical protein